MASSGRSIDLEPGEPIPERAALRARARHRAVSSFGAWRSDGAARWLFIWPTVLLILALSIFPLVASVALSLSRLAFTQGSVRYPMTAHMRRVYAKVDVDVKQGGNQIEYSDQDPRIHRMFVEELARKGIAVTMGELAGAK